MIQIVLASNRGKQHAIVRQVCGAGKDRLIYKENSRFTLCSVDNNVEAVMLMGTNSIMLLKWWTTNGMPMLWRRLITKSERSDKLTSRLLLSEFIKQEHT